MDRREGGRMKTEITNQSIYSEDEKRGERADIFKLISKERTRQDAQWGGQNHDNQHCHHDWLAYILKQLGKAVTWDPRLFKDCMVKTAALSVAAAEWADRVWVHFEDPGEE
jgi:hypothetical protein